MVKQRDKAEDTMSIKITVSLYEELIKHKLVPMESFSHTISRLLSRNKAYILKQEKKE